VIAAAAVALRPGGVLVFTVEEATDPALADAFAIQRHGRYHHGAGYVSRLLASCGLSVAIERGELRMESGLPVQGLIVQATRPERPSAERVDDATPRGAGGTRG
jgi:predicted TPR repeat methyltransferase